MITDKIKQTFNTWYWAHYLDLMDNEPSSEADRHGYWVYESWKAGRTQALEEVQAICRVVQDQVVENAGAPYQAGRNIGAIVCECKIKELLK